MCKMATQGEELQEKCSALEKKIIRQVEVIRSAVRSTIFYDHGDETIRAGGDVIKARDRII